MNNTINIQLEVPSTGKYTLEEFVAKVKAYMLTNCPTQ